MGPMNNKTMVPINRPSRSAEPAYGDEREPVSAR